MLGRSLPLVLEDLAVNHRVHIARFVVPHLHPSQRVYVQYGTSVSSRADRRGVTRRGVAQTVAVAVAVAGGIAYDDVPALLHRELQALERVGVEERLDVVQLLL